MLLKNKWIEEDISKLHDVEFDDFDPPILIRPEHERFAERIRKTLYYGKLPTEDRPSLPMTEIAVNYIKDAAPKELGKIDMYLASDIGRKAYVSPCSMMLGMIYIERLKHKNPEYLDQVSSSDLFLISMMLASKYLYDEGIDEEVYNDEWAESADMATEDVNQLEREFLRAIDWSLFTQPEDFERLLSSMEERIAFRQGLQRGFWTYTDIVVHLQNTRFRGSLRDIMQELCKVVLVCSMAYTAGIATMVASVTTLSLLKTHCVIPVETWVPDIAGFVALGENAAKNVDELGTDVYPGFKTSLDVSETDDEKQNGHYTDNSLGVSVDDCENETSVDYGKGKQTLGLTLPGLLTLTLIKDTLTQFVIALNHESGHECDTDSEDLGQAVGCKKCACSNCPLKSTTQEERRNRFGKPLPPYSVWSSLKCAYGYGTNYSRSTSNNPWRVEGRGTSQDHKVGENFDPTGDQDAENDNSHDEFFDDRYYKCPSSMERSQDWRPVPRCHQEKIAVDIPIRFHTTGFVMS